LRKIDNDVPREPGYALEILVIKLIGSVGWPITIFVRTGEEIQDRNILRVETGHIGRQIGIASLGAGWLRGFEEAAACYQSRDSEIS
jgi:hypothetical protein